MSTPVSNFIQARVRVTAPTCSWIETYNLIARTYDDAKIAFVKILNARYWLLPYGFKLKKAVLSDAAVRGDRLPLKSPADYLSYEGGLLDGETVMATDAVCNDPSTALLFRFDNGQGKYSNHWLRGLRDDWVIDNEFTLVLDDPVAYNHNGGLYYGYDNTTTTPIAIDVVNNYLSIVRDLTAIYTPTGDVTNPWSQTVYDMATGGNWWFMRTSSRRPGQRDGLGKGRQPNFA